MLKLCLRVETILELTIDKKINKLFSKFIHYYHVNNSMKARFLKFLLNEKQNWPSSQVELPNVLLSPAISMKMIEMLFKS